MVFQGGMWGHQAAGDIDSAISQLLTNAWRVSCYPIRNFVTLFERIGRALQASLKSAVDDDQEMLG